MLSIDITLGDLQDPRWIRNVFALVVNELLDYFSRHPTLVSTDPLNLNRLISRYEESYLIDHSTILLKIINLINKDFTFTLKLKINQTLLMKKRLFRKPTSDDKAIRKLSKETYILHQNLNHVFGQLKPKIRVEAGIYNASFD